MRHLIGIIVFNRHHSFQCDCEGGRGEGGDIQVNIKIPQPSPVCGQMPTSNQ